jgi:hypothetical protein
MTTAATALPPHLSSRGDLRVEDRPFDETQELRAMILAALPYPPLPVTLVRVEDGSAVLGDAVLQTSHDILSNLLKHACATNTVRENRERQAAQQELLRGFLQAIVRDGLQPPPQLFRTYCEFSQRHIATYIKGAKSAPEIRYEPLDSVCKGDAAHRRMCDYMAAQGRLLELTEGLSAQDWACREYADMLIIARDRLVGEVNPSASVEECEDEDEDEDED